MLSSLKNSRGFSLVGILVGVSLLGILTVGMMQVFSNMMKGQNYGKFRAQVENFSEELRNQLGTKDICTATFVGTILDPLTTKSLPAIIDSTGKKIYQTGATLGDNSFTLASIDLKSSPSISWYTDDDVTKGTGRMTLTVTYRGVTEQAGPKDIFRTYTIATHRDPQKKLIDCTALSKMSDGIWHYNTSTIADIYYFGGNVGIGTTAPTASFQVVGSMATTIDTKTADYTLTDSDNIILGDASTAAVKITLPDATKMKGRQYTIKKQDASANLVTVITTNSQVIDAATTSSLSKQFQFITATSTGTNWSVTGTNISLGSSSGVDIQTFSTSGTWTKPSSGSVVQVTCWGAGGAGGGKSIYWFTTCGGGGGGYAIKEFQISSLPATIAVTIGKGGAGTSGATGGNGGSSSFGSLLIATGGTGGSAGGSEPCYAGSTGGPLSGSFGGCNGGIPPSATYGGGGGGGATYTSGYMGGYQGGSSMNAGKGGDGALSGNAGSGEIPGGGGGAAYAGVSGAGGDGLCVVKTF